MNSSRTNQIFLLSLAAGTAVVIAVMFMFLNADGREQSASPRPTDSASEAPTTVIDSGNGGTGREAADTNSAQPRPQVSPNSLNVSIPMTHPACDGTGIVVLANAVTPGRYEAEVQRYLDMHPGASYLRTDESCPSLRQRDDAGNPIYAVYRPAGRTQAEVCAAVRAAGGGAYGKWLDTITNPRQMMTC